ncbi:MAG TPA: hypothetical protein VM580_11460, partial [Labilithrix sp.]|nr:hypothetical protein [Labilithrix sp.]
MIRSYRFFAPLLALAVSAVIALACSSSKPDAAGAEDAVLADNVARLVQEKCATCHREGGMAPFSLTTPEQLSAMGHAAKQAVARRSMPPWGAFDGDDCSMGHKFKGDLSLTQDEIDMFVRWVDRGMPRSRVSGTAPSTSAASSDTTIAGRTDTFDVASDYELPAMGEDELRCFPMDPGLADDMWVAESIVVPGDPKVVHHALVYLDPYREGRERAQGARSYPCFGGPELTNPTLLLAWSPGGTSTTYGEDTALLIPKGAHLVVQVHYHPIETATTGRVAVEVRKLPAKPPRVATFVLVGNAETGEGPSKLLRGDNDPAGRATFLIPSDAKNHVETMDIEVPSSFGKGTVSAVGAHMHWAGVGMKIEVIRRNAA